jgi:hypothetical protein
LNTSKSSLLLLSVNIFPMFSTIFQHYAHRMYKGTLLGFLGAYPVAAVALVVGL